MIKQIIQREEALIGNFADADIEDMRLQFKMSCEGATEESKSEGYSPEYLSYVYGNQPVCPYCGAVSYFADGTLSCMQNGCFKLFLPISAGNVADVAWQMWTTADRHRLVPELT